MSVFDSPETFIGNSHDSVARLDGSLCTNATASDWELGELEMVQAGCPIAVEPLFQGIHDILTMAIFTRKILMEIEKSVLLMGVAMAAC